MYRPKYSLISNKHLFCLLHIGKLTLLHSGNIIIILYIIIFRKYIP